MAIPRLLVVGGNGYLGSAVCKAAVGKGWEVSSMSSSGTPYTTPAGHTPKWAQSVTWHRASAFEPSTYTELVGKSTAVVHTLGILLEDGGYKRSIREGNFFGLSRSILKGLTGSGEASNPLKTAAEYQKTYEAMNRDSALIVLDTMFNTPSKARPPRSFVYISAAGAFAPIVPERYVTTKREAEASILVRCTPESGIHPTIVRPGLMYEPQVRPLTTLPAFGLSLSAGLYDAIKPRIPFSPGSTLAQAAEALATHPLHVDHVADAIVRCVADDIQGIIDVQTMRRWAGFEVSEETTPHV